MGIERIHPGCGFSFPVAFMPQVNLRLKRTEAWFGSLEPKRLRLKRLNGAPRKLAWWLLRAGLWKRGLSGTEHRMVFTSRTAENGVYTAPETPVRVPS